MLSRPAVLLFGMQTWFFQAVQISFSSKWNTRGSARNELDVENNPKHFNKIKVKNINNINLKKWYCSGKNTMHLFLVKEKRKTNTKILKNQNKTQWEKLLWKLNLKNGNEKQNYTTIITTLI